MTDEKLIAEVARVWVDGGGDVEGLEYCPDEMTLEQIEEWGKHQRPAHVELVTEPLLPCPFCGKTVNLEDYDTLYPSGTGWLFDEELQMRTYHRYNEVPVEQRCYTMHCPIQSGGCGAEMHGDTKAETISKWNKRAEIKE